MTKFGINFNEHLVYLEYNNVEGKSYKIETIFNWLHEIYNDRAVFKELEDMCVSHIKKGYNSTEIVTLINHNIFAYSNNSLMCFFWQSILDYLEYHNEQLIKKILVSTKAYLKAHSIEKQFDYLHCLIEMLENIYTEDNDNTFTDISFTISADLISSVKDFNANVFLITFYQLLKHYSGFFRCKCSICGRYFCGSSLDEYCCNFKKCQERYAELAEADAKKELISMRERIMDMYNHHTHFVKEDTGSDEEKEKFIEFALPQKEKLLKTIIKYSIEGATPKELADLYYEKEECYRVWREFRKKLVKEFDEEVLRNIRK